MQARASGSRKLLPATRPAARQDPAAPPPRRRRLASAPPRLFGGATREERRANRAARAPPDNADLGSMTLLETSSISRATKTDYDRRPSEFQTLATTRSLELSSSWATDAALTAHANRPRRDGALATEVEKVCAAWIF